ncbi:MAG: murD [Chloroflexi bacterium]|nr:murD [Chloroflexota bacterium]
MGSWAGRRVVIIGAARQGVALAEYLLRHGAEVILNDQRPAEQLADARQSLESVSTKGRLSWVLGSHPLEILDGADSVCVSGGVPLSLPLVIEAQRRDIPLTNDSQIFLEVAPCTVIGITGSAGKTTTTSLVGMMAEESVRSSHGTHPARAWVGGNIGNPLISSVDEMQPDDLAVMELSSFQLEIMNRSPQVAAVLNITPNHLDRHASMDEYLEAKARILTNQSAGSWAILGRDDPGAWSLTERVVGQLSSFGLNDLPAAQAGSYLRNQEIWVKSAWPSGKLDECFVMPRSEVLLRGEHNLLNVLAACAIAAASNLPVRAMRQAVKEFRGVSHRLEFVRTWRGSDWYNDSIATAPERAMAAIRSFDEPLLLLAGGRDKNLPWEAFAELALSRVRHLVLFGEAAGKIDVAIQSAAEHNSPTAMQSLVRCTGLQQAVRQAAELAGPGDVVLLSPGCTSFDEFKDFEERGKCFVQWVKALE